jgi:hypothetical protein
MKNLTFTQKITICIFCFGIALIGFMIKLPSIFRHHDKEMHLIFYFFSAAFLNVLFQKRHFIIFLFLLFFGIFIELFQQFSNRFYTHRTHGKFDIDDVASNITGLILFSILWIGFKTILFQYSKIFKPETK